MRQLVHVSLTAAVLLILTTVLGTGLSQQTSECDASQAKGIGKPFSPELGEAARRASGANSVRPVGPGIISSADRRPDRLNVELDHAGIVIGFRCG